MIRLAIRVEVYSRPDAGVDASWNFCIFQNLDFAQIHRVARNLSTRFHTAVRSLVCRERGKPYRTVFVVMLAISSVSGQTKGQLRRSLIGQSFQ
jgi:hypothetical protein